MIELILYTIVFITLFVFFLVKIINWIYSTSSYIPHVLALLIILGFISFFYFVLRYLWSMRTILKKQRNETDRSSAISPEIQEKREQLEQLIQEIGIITKTCSHCGADFTVNLLSFTPLCPYCKGTIPYSRSFLKKMQIINKHQVELNHMSDSESAKLENENKKKQLIERKVTKVTIIFILLLTAAIIVPILTILLSVH